MLSLRRWQTWALSLLFWTIYAILDSAGSFAIVSAIGEKPFLRHILLWNFAEAYIWVLFTPLIYAIALKFSFNRRSWKKSLAVHIPASLVIAGLCAWVLIHMNMLFGWADLSTPFRARLLSLALQDLPRYFVTAGVAQLVSYQATLRERETESARLETSLAQAQIEILRSQMEPHFLFNALNSIATLTRTDPASAERMTLKLAALLRVSLDCAGSQEIPLKQELDFLQNYIDIQQTRFRDRLKVHFEIDPSLLFAPVPSLILQPLVENAIRHGIAKSAALGCVDITAARDNGTIRIEIADNGVGMKNGEAAEGGGFGLRNTRARLQQLYGERQHFDLQDVPGGGCRVTLTIPLPKNGTVPAH